MSFYGRQTPAPEALPAPPPPQPIGFIGFPAPNEKECKAKFCLTVDEKLELKKDLLAFVKRLTSSEDSDFNKRLILLEIVRLLLDNFS